MISQEKTAYLPKERLTTCLGKMDHTLLIQKIEFLKKSFQDYNDNFIPRSNPDQSS